MRLKRFQPLLAGVMATAGALAWTAPATQEDYSPHRVVEFRGKVLVAAVTDAWLQGRVESALLLNEELEAQHLAVDVTNRQARLTGTVASGIDRILATRIAASVDGVKGIENRLSVNPAVKQNRHPSFKQLIENATLAARIAKQLERNASPAGLGVEVVVASDSVTLTGYTASDRTKALASRIARRLAQPRRVDNQLTIHGSATGP